MYPARITLMYQSDAPGAKPACWALAGRYGVISADERYYHVYTHTPPSNIHWLAWASANPLDYAVMMPESTTETATSENLPSRDPKYLLTKYLRWVTPKTLN